MTDPIGVTWHDGILVVRDDHLPGGTKTRAIHTLLDGAARDVVYASPAYGYAQIALAHGAEATGRRAHIFTAARRRPHPRTEEAFEAGATIHPVAPGYLTQTQAEARTWAAEHNATLLPFGFDTDAFREALAAAIATAVEAATGSDPASRTLRRPREVWVAAGSGTTSRALQAVWPEADHHAVAVGRPPDAGQATTHTAPEPFERDAKNPPPYPSTPNFDAKTWQFARHRGEGTLIWNVAG